VGEETCFFLSLTAFSSFYLEGIEIGEQMSKEGSSHIQLTSTIRIFSQTFVELSTPENQKGQF
jgi:hypothetical protein